MERVNHAIGDEGGDFAMKALFTIVLVANQEEIDASHGERFELLVLWKGFLSSIHELEQVARIILPNPCWIKPLRMLFMKILVADPAGTLNHKPFFHEHLLKKKSLPTIQQNLAKIKGFM